VRWRWKPSSMAIWDSRSAALRRDGLRLPPQDGAAGIVGDKPYGVATSPGRGRSPSVREAALAV
jgi:hypothetical protein